MTTLRQLEKQAEEFLKQKNYEDAFSLYEEGIAHLDKILEQTTDQYKKQVLLQKRFELTVMLESIVKIVKSDGLRKKLSQVSVNPSKERPNQQMGKTNSPAKCADTVNVSHNIGVTWNNIAGLEEVKSSLEEAISWPIMYPEEMKVLGTLLKGLLLYGPPGCGKTLLAKAAAGSLNIPLIIVTPSEVLDKYLGESEKQLARIFGCARVVSPCLVLFDEVDKLLPMPGSSTSDGVRRLEGQLLTTLDGLDTNEGIIVLFTTNEPENINPALIRTGRVDRHILVPPPDLEAREAIFDAQLRDIPLDGVTPRWLSKMTKQDHRGAYSGADCTAIASELKKALFRVWVVNKEVRPREQGESVPMSKRTPLNRSTANTVLNQFAPGIKPDLLAKYSDWQELNS